MPSKNTIKSYIENGYYHVYNRGVEKRNIFLDQSDYKMFLYYLRLYLAPKDELRQLKSPGIRTDRVLRNNLSDEVDLLSFALMPNHFHFLLKQKNMVGMKTFMKRLQTAYAMYFNNKYHRVGPLFQGIYKAALITNDQYIVHLSRYIHLNPLKCYPPLDFIYSSYECYLERMKISWLKPEEVLVNFKTVQQQELNKIFTYQSFVEDYLFDSKELLLDLVLEDEL